MKVIIILINNFKFKFWNFSPLVNTVGTLVYFNKKQNCKGQDRLYYKMN